MTRQEISFNRDNSFSIWSRRNLPDSSTGFMVSDIDFILYDWNLKKIMLLETKCKNDEVKTWQRNLFNNIHRWIKKGIDDDWEYKGFHLIQYENTSFIDGKVYFDKKEIEEKELIEILSFGKIKNEWKSPNPPCNGEDIKRYFD